MAREFVDINGATWSIEIMLRQSIRLKQLGIDFVSILTDFASLSAEQLLEAILVGMGERAVAAGIANIEELEKLLSRQDLADKAIEALQLAITDFSRPEIGDPARDLLAKTRNALNDIQTEATQELREATQAITIEQIKTDLKAHFQNVSGLPKS